jgi:hypothetical protein
LQGAAHKSGYSHHDVATEGTATYQSQNPGASTLSPIHSLIGFARSNTAALLACCGVEVMQLHTSM